MARPPRRPDRPAGYLARPARLGAAALHRVARVVQRAAETLSPAAPSAAAAPPAEPPPRRPGQPPEHWLGLVREHAPELLIGRDQTAVERPSLPGYAEPLPVPPTRTVTGDPPSPAAAAIVTGTGDTTIAAALATVSGSDAPSAYRALRSHSTEDDGARPGSARSSGIHQERSADRMPPARPLARWAGAVWERLSGKARTETPAVDDAVRSGQTASPAPPLRLTQPKTPDAFPAWSWVGPSGKDTTRPAYRITAAEWPSLPTALTTTTTERTRPPIRHAAEPVEFADEANPWPDLPDDSPLWTLPATGYSAERLARLEREQAGG